MRLGIVGLALLAVGASLLAVGILPLPDALALVERVGPILLFVVAATIVAELASEAGLFAAIAERLARLGLGRAWMLWLLVVVLAVVVTVFLSLDTTAVLLTPVVILLARHNGLSPLPFALTTVWLANTGSLLLPVSNLTNLLAADRLGDPSPAEFAGLLGAAAAAAIAVPVAALGVLFRRELGARFSPARVDPPADRVLFVIAAVVVGTLVPLLVSGVPVWIPASAAALVLLTAFAIRRRSALRRSLLPGGILLFASGLFVVVEALHALGLGLTLAPLAGSGESLPDLLRMAGAGLLGANLVDNLPAYLALEPVADSPLRLAALLIGVNAGPLITPWASLATLLWHARLTAMGVEFRWSRYIVLGAVVAPLTVAAATVALAASAT